MPKIGLRIIKSAVAVFLCLLIGVVRGGAGMPFYSAIAAVLCMQPDVKNSLKVAINRIIGTLIGGLCGMLMLMLLRWGLPELPVLVECLLISCALIPLMYITVLIKKPAATYITCVVFLSVTVSHGVDLVPYAFALNRMLDTLIGILVSLGINVLPFWRNDKNDKKEKE